MKVKTSKFVKRQTSYSRFSHTTHSWDELAELTEKHIDNNISGRKGVILVQVPSKGFFSALAKVEDVTEWIEVYEARQEGEEKVMTRHGVVDKKPEAHFVDIVLYHVDVLAEDEDYVKEGDHEWEIISINARVEEEPAPVPPITMSRNYLVEKGGTKVEYSAEEFAKSIWFWNQHCLVCEK